VALVLYIGANPPTTQSGALRVAGLLFAVFALPVVALVVWTLRSAKKGKQGR
jgi:hypothetical protein